MIYNLWKGKNKKANTSVGSNTGQVINRNQGQFPISSQSNFTVFMLCDSTVTEDEKDMLVEAMKNAELIYGCDFEFIRYEATESSVTRSDIPVLRQGLAEELVRSAPVNDKGQYGASEIIAGMKKLLDDSGLKGALIIFTSRDLYLNNTWCFGAARVGGGVSVQSTARFRGLPQYDKQAVITRTLRHELGHIHRLAADHKRDKVEKKYGWHCTSRGCTMRQSPTLKVLLKHAREEDPENCLCDLCQRDLMKFQAIYY